eukprot:3862673-Prymnesium_polylepis.1
MGTEHGAAGREGRGCRGGAGWGAQVSARGSRVAVHLLKRRAARRAGRLKVDLVLGGGREHAVHSAGGAHPHRERLDAVVDVAADDPCRAHPDPRLVDAAGRSAVGAGGGAARVALAVGGGAAGGFDRGRRRGAGGQHEAAQRDGGRAGRSARLQHVEKRHHGARRVVDGRE